MKRHHLFSVVALAALVAACADDPSEPGLKTTPQFSAVEGAEYGTYLVRFKGNGVPSGFEAKVEQLGGEVIFAHAGAGVAAVAGLIPSAAEELAARGDIASVDADAYTEVPSAESGSVEAAAADVSSASDPAGAIWYVRQWNMRAISAQQAWAAGKLGSASVKVGILDTGIDYLHRDLQNRVDLTLSRSFLSASENNRLQAAFPGAHPVADLHYHGTHVASTVASNGVLTAGVTSGITLVGLKVCAPGFPNPNPNLAWRGTCPTSGTLAAILYAADHGIPIINMSLGGSFQRRQASAAGGFGPSFLATINDVMAYANRKGTTVVVSAGNSAFDMDHDKNGYKSYCSAAHVICVSATGPTFTPSVNGPFTNPDALAYYSNYGRSAISVAGPGGNYIGVTASCSGFSLPITACQNRASLWGVRISGTSMAAPHVAGVAALAASNGVSGPAQIRAAVESGADDLGQPGTDPAYGKGRVNAARTAGVL